MDVITGTCEFRIPENTVVSIGKFDGEEGYSWNQVSDAWLDGYKECQKEWKRYEEENMVENPYKWHYVKDGVYPTDDKKVLCILGDFENDNLEVGYYSQVEGDSNWWRFEDYVLPDDSEEGWGVSAWKEIVLPKESE